MSESLTFSRGRPRHMGDAAVLLGLFSYGGWWVFWLARGRFPPAPILAITGMPAPSTGVIRSLGALARGEFAESFLWNPLAIPMTLLLVVSLVWLGVLLVRRRRLVLPKLFLPLWLVLLAAAWVGKFIVGPGYW